MIRSSSLVLFSFSLLACNGSHDGAPPSNASALASASAGAPDAPVAPPSATTEMTLHAEDDGKSFDVARGGTVTFALPSNAGTGYVWVPTQVDATVLTQQGDRTSDVSSDTPGAPKLDVYHFAAASPGSTVVEVIEAAISSAAPARTIHVTVNVR